MASGEGASRERITGRTERDRDESLGFEGRERNRERKIQEEQAM